MSGLFGADRPTDPDLPGPFHHGRQHNVHDADSADQQRDSGNAHHDDLKDQLRLTLLLEEVGRDDGREIAGILVGRRQDGADDLRSLDRVHSRIDFDVNAVDLCLSENWLLYPRSAASRCSAA